MGELLLTLVYEVDRNVDGNVILNPDGSPTLVLDGDGAPIQLADALAAETEYARFVDTVDLYRQLVLEFSQPIAELPEP